MNVDICNESGHEIDVNALLDLVRHVLDEMRIHPQAELSLLLVDSIAMERLHVQWMDEPGPTDVLAFPMDELRPGRRDDPAEDPGLLGDVVLCPEVAQQQAAEAGHSTADELHLLCTHGILHLLGYDHVDAESEREMFAEQRRLLAGWRAARAAG
ncbi:MAG TPA: rRNA maturation RNase YbeY [Sporichthyaceae bacterium]|nr:rRNA maturation RNase YbeY [Sporichthyaceae bacterium]